MRLLLILVSLFLVVLLIKRTLSRSSGSSMQGGSSSSPNASGASTVNMVACAHCHVHLAQTEALQQGSEFYCCADHLHRHHPPRSS